MERGNLTRHENSAFESAKKLTIHENGDREEKGDLSPSSREKLDGVLARLQGDQRELTNRVQELLPRYGDQLLKSHLERIQGILELALQQIHQITDESSRPLWRELMALCREYLAKYEVLLQSTKGRKELREAQTSLDEINVLLRCIRTPKPKDHNDSLETVVCCICLDNKVQVSLGCGHCLCCECSQSIDKCAICREKVKPQDIRPVYL